LVHLLTVTGHASRFDSALTLEENIVDHFRNILLRTDLYFFEQLSLTIDFDDRPWGNGWWSAGMFGRGRSRVTGLNLHITLGFRKYLFGLGLLIFFGSRM
jgi:hypothetical protein